MSQRFHLFLLAVLLLIAFSNCNNMQHNTFYVAMNGNDSWSGKLSEPNLDQSDGPLATLEQANAIILDRQKSDAAKQKKIIVQVRAGNYLFSESLQLESQHHVTWQNFPGEKVAFIGAKPIAGFQPVTDKQILNRLDKTAQDKIFVCDLKSQGITNYGEITRRGGPGMELFFNGKRMTIARYPNEGWLKIADVPQTGKTLLNKGLDREKRFDGVPVGRHYGRIKYDGDRPTQWSNENEIYLHGYWTWDWSDSYQKVGSIDLAKNEITITEPHHHYGYTKNQRYYFLNILEELDQPGEWVLDRNSGLLYFYPPAAIPENEVFVSMLEQPMVVLENCENVNFQGIHFEFSRGNGIVINGGSNNLIAGCAFRNLGADAVVINSGSENGMTSCDIYDVSMGGIQLRGGDRKQLIPANNFAVNNDIYNYSQWIRTGQLAINLLGVGNRIAHNLIHDAPHGAIYVQGNEHLLEFNEIFNVCYETGDAGAIHTGRNYTWRGNVYRYNYVHHLKGPGLHGCTALYLDDFTSGYTLYGNICYKSGRGALLGGGRDNVVENNIFIGCAPTIVQDARGLSWASNYFDGEITVLTDSLEAMNFRDPPYSEKYPELLTLYDDEPAVPKNNKIIRNISYGGRFIERYDYFAYDHSVVTIKDNVIADSIIYKRVKQAPVGWEPYYLNLDTEDDYIYFKQGDTENVPDLADNLILDSDPGFENIEKEDFRLKPDSPAFMLGFKKIPIEKIGLFVDEHRTELPPNKQLD